MKLTMTALPETELVAVSLTDGPVRAPTGPPEPTGTRIVDASTAAVLSWLVEFENDDALQDDGRRHPSLDVLVSQASRVLRALARARADPSHSGEVGPLDRKTWPDAHPG